MEDRRKLTLSIGDLVEAIQGEVLNCADKSGEIVENLMVGAMCVDPAPLYFSLKANKAVITRGDRPDIQMGALETPTKCLILTGGIKPLPNIIQRAEEKKVPIIVVDKDTTTTLSEIEEGLSEVQPHN